MNKLYAILIILIFLFAWISSVSGSSEVIISENISINKNNITGNVQLQNLVNQSIYLLVIGSNLQETYLQRVYLKGTGSWVSFGYTIPSNLPKTIDNKNATQIDINLYLFVLNATSFYNLKQVSAISVNLQNSRSSPGFEIELLFAGLIVISVILLKKREN